MKIFLCNGSYFLFLNKKISHTTVIEALFLRGINHITMSQTITNDILETALDFIKAVENRTSADVLHNYYHPEVIQTEYPNGLLKTTANRDLQALREASERGQKVLRQERYEIMKSHVSGDTVILEVIWRGTLAVPIGTIPAGGEMKAYFAQFYEFKDGKIFRQRNYDCFEPFN
jgi:ketosteroid isomerase-like protein